MPPMNPPTPAAAPDGHLRRAHRRLDAVVKDFPPAAFSFVMATGILSTALALVGRETSASVLLWIAVAAGALLSAALAWRAIAHPGPLFKDLDDPAKTFGFFTIVAGANVLGLGFDMVGTPSAAVALAIVAGVFWVGLNYGIPSSMLLRDRSTPILQDANGSWFLWVVATQSMANALAVIARNTHNELAGAAAVAAWGVGLVLYLLVGTLVTLRLLTLPNRPENLSPTYWIFMGATAITVLAGAKVLAMPADLPVMVRTAVFVAGASYMLWALGMWWIPLLVVFGIWRHGMRRYPVRYETGLWAIVFPLGMMSAASIAFGRGESVAVMVGVGEVGVWVAAAAWAGTTVLMLASLVRWLRAGKHPAPAA
ncbi:hypothetical protein GCM10009715_31240 [Paeniglutamicibacter psychrophenolicus]